MKHSVACRFSAGTRCALSRVTSGATCSASAALCSAWGCSAKNSRSSSDRRVVASARSRLRAYSTAWRRTASRSPSNWIRWPWHSSRSGSFCASANHTVPTGLPATAPEGPAIPLTAIATLASGALERAFGHGAHHGVTHRPFGFDEFLRHAEIARLGGVRITHEAAVEPVGAAGNVGAELGDPAAGAGFGRDQAALRGEQPRANVATQRSEGTVVGDGHGESGHANSGNRRRRRAHVPISGNVAHPSHQRKMPRSRMVPCPTGRPTLSHTLQESVEVAPTPTVNGPTIVRPVRNSEPP